MKRSRGRTFSSRSGCRAGSPGFWQDSRNLEFPDVLGSLAFCKSCGLGGDLLSHERLKRRQRYAKGAGGLLHLDGRVVRFHPR
jgi:hypothetical protein